MIQLTRDRAAIDFADGHRDRLAAEFAAAHVVRLPRFLGPDLLALLETRLATARFVPRIEHGIEIEHTLADAAVFGLFLVTLNDPRLFAWVEEVTACGTIGSFAGRVYRRHQPTGPGHYYPWHDDVKDDRLVGLSINLGQEPYGGGLLQIRDAATGYPIREVANTGYGDAMLFRISSAIEHQVTPVSGAVPRTVLAGWFCAGPWYADAIRGRLPM